MVDGMRSEARYTPTIMSGAVVRYQTGYDRGKYRDIFGGAALTDWSAEISASRDGVCLQGVWPTLNDAAQIAGVQALLQEAWQAHLAIAAAERSGRGFGHDEAKRIADAFNARHVTAAPAPEAVDG